MDSALHQSSIACPEQHNYTRCPAEGTGAAIFTLYLYPLVCGIGVVLNVLNLFVLSSGRSQLRGSIAAYLKAIAVADLITLLGFLPSGPAALCPTCCQDKNTAQYYDFVLFICNASAGSSNWTTVLLAFERWLAVRTLTRPHINEPKLPVKVKVFIICTITLALNLPRLSFVKEVVSENGHNNIFGWLHVTITRFLPFVLLAILNAGLTWILLRSRRQIAAIEFHADILQRRNQQQRRITQTLIALGIVFIIGNIPMAFNFTAVYASIFGECSIYSDTYTLFKAFANSLEMTAYAAPFIIYCTFSRGYVAALRELFKGGNIRSMFLTRPTLTSPTTPYFRNVRTGRAARARAFSFPSDHTSVGEVRPAARVLMKQQSSPDHVDGRRSSSVAHLPVVE